MPQKYFFGTRHFYFGEEWVKNGNNVTIFSSSSNHLTDKLPVFDDKSMVEDINGVQTVWLNSLKSKNPSSFGRIIGWIHFEWLLLRFVKKHLNSQKKAETTKKYEALEIPDVVIVSSLSLLSVLSGWYFARKFKSRFILEIRDIWPLTAVQSVGYSKWHPFIFVLSWIEKFGYRNADAIVGTMPNLIEHIQNVEPSFKKCVTIPQGVTINQLDRHEFLDSRYVDEVFYRPAFRVAYTGTLNMSDNPVDLLLDAAVIMGPDAGVDIFILGRGTMKDTYVKKYSHHAHIHFPEAIDKKYVRDFLSKIDLCYDAIGGAIARYGHSRNKWMDYMSAGKPILCAATGHRSILDEADCGTFVPFYDIDALYKEILRYRDMDKKELERLGKNARDYVVKYRTFDKLAAKYEELFNDN
jgi:glycosyltransferase involved in cell wall biosynthesis